ncbi:MAG: family ATPase [Glaciihabitans sp.]|nr:family ATPase [Glaciihabitans sp.]
MESVRPPLRSIRSDSDRFIDAGTRRATLGPVAQVLRDGLDLGPVTVLVGENGVGKSTLVEAIAIAYGMGSEGGSTGSRHSTRASESDLSEALLLERGIGASRDGFFLRAETMHGFFTYLEDNPGNDDVVFHERSHGESFLDLLAARSRYPGLWILDEPESGLSFTGLLTLLINLRSIVETGQSQVILSTHSPILAALPGADIYELGSWGMKSADWQHLEIVRDWRSFLDSPERFLRHLF